MFAALTHYYRETWIERKRVLPGPAKILVRRGQTVAAHDPVVEELIIPAHLILDVGRGLGVPAGRVDQLLHCKAGMMVSKGDLLAGPVGLARRVMRAPQAGKVISTGRGMLVLELTGQPRQLVAGISGEVVDLISERGVMIRSHGALIQAGWGNGRIGQGKLSLLLDTPDQELTISHLLEQPEGAVVVGGFCSDPVVLATAGRMALGGIVLAGLSPSLFEAVNSLRIPFLLIDGFGRHVINAQVDQILRAYDGQVAELNAGPGGFLSDARPELVIPSAPQAQSMKPVVLDLFAPGKIVRLVGSMDTGRLGTLVDLIGEARLPSGLLADSAQVRLENGDLVNYPLANLEILV